MGIRKSATRLTETERDNFLRAVLTLKNTIANPGDPAEQQISIYDQFVAIHLYAVNINFGMTTGLNMGHANSAFCPWHRYFLYQFEQALQTVDPTVMLPYWDWTDQFGTENILFQDNFIGPDGTVVGTSGRCVMSGYFAFNKPGTGGNPTPLPAWYPATLNGWRVRPSLAHGHFGPSDPPEGKTLMRQLDSFTSLETLSHVQTCLSKTVYENALTSFRVYLELGPDGGIMHNRIHQWVGGSMSDVNSSVNDVVFFLHHCNIDRLWAMWQIDGHAGSAFYPAAGRPLGHNLNDLMWPWVGAAVGYTSGNVQPDIVLPDFTIQPAKHPADVLDHRALGYCYDSEAVIGIALDQTGSMLQMTPDPMVVAAPDVTKWEAAKRGVAALLHDCETAYLQRETYVIAGIETFRTLATNVFTPIFPGVPFGLIKNASTTYSEAGFNTAIGSQSPGGSTPLADALLDTESNMVRAPFGNLPANDTRFLCMLTDGLLTSGAPLSSIMPGQLQDTIIFAMGFGTGADVDYTTIADIVSKGKTAPPLGMVPTQQVYHGENAGQIDKFFTNSVAHALGYIPVIDPVYELHVGEHVDTPFYVSEADQSFMFTVQGLDYNGENWQCFLMLPNGSMCDCNANDDDHSSEHSHSAGTEHDHDDDHGTGQPNSHLHEGFLVTSNSKNGRITIFLNRNGGEAEHWTGRWNVRVMYKMTDKNMRMHMPSLIDRLFPVGARPVRGPVYAQLNKPYNNRLSSRVLPAQFKGQAVNPVEGVNENREGPCAVSVNIYCRTTLHIQLKGADKKNFAGYDLALRIEAKDHTGAKVKNLNAVARLVAPAFSTGNIYADKRARSLISKRKFLFKTNSRTYFNEPAFLADFETANPDSLAMIDKVIEIKSTGKNYVTFDLKQNNAPGIYRLGCQVSGTVQYGDADPLYFTRILNFEIPFRLKVDASKTIRFIQIKQNTIIVTWTLADKAGNIASPAVLHDAKLLINGKEIVAKFTNDYSGSYTHTIKFSGKQFRLTADKKKIYHGDIDIPLNDGKKLHLKTGDKFNLQIQA